MVDPVGELVELVVHLPAEAHPGDVFLDGVMVGGVSLLESGAYLFEHSYSFLSIRLMRSLSVASK